ncbi:MAG: tRNA epoxyqueuosine(34) reductase QueG [Pseudomonadota bacterium]
MAKTIGPPASQADMTTQIRAYALALGFDTARITGADLPPSVEKHLSDVIAEGHHGTMAWMEERVPQRASPRTLWPETRSVIMLGLNYGPTTDPLAIHGQKDHASLSVYAQNEDYHDIIKKRLKQLGRWMAVEFDCELKVFVDTAPVAEKPLAAQAGLGWQGKHTNLVSRSHGSWLFLGAIFTTLELDKDKPEIDHCGSCTSCLDACPTNAFPAPYRLDARRCISYLTIEHKGTIDRVFRRAMGNRIYGCDDCLAVCPWNKFAQDAKEAKLIARDELKNPPLADLASLDDPSFRSLFRKSPVKRIGRDRFVRNVMIAIGNSQNELHLPVLLPRLRDDAPTVRAMAVWAWRELGGDEELLANLLSHENDQQVLDEWHDTDADLLTPATHKSP